MKIHHFNERQNVERLVLKIEKLINDIDEMYILNKEPKTIKKLNKRLNKTYDTLYHKLIQFDYEKKKENLTRS